MISLPFQEWFTSNSLVGGDWKFFWPENLKEILSYSFAWDSSLNTGLGVNNIPFLWLNSYVSYLSYFLTQIFHIPWNIAEKLLFFWPIVFISFFSAFFLSRIFLKNKFLNIFSGIIYLTNTYALMIFSGGQVGVALAYSLAPFVLTRFIKISNLKLSIIAGLILALQIFFDPRIAVLSMIMVAIYFLFYLKRLISNILFVFVIPLIVTLFLHMFWIIPIVMSHTNPVTATLSDSKLSSGLVRFLSFAYFENTFSLLHPNWPENIFGKIGFMRPEFILIPILAFSSLLFVSNRKILFFAFLALLGSFLAKGSNGPFGEIYIWLTDHIGLFAMYRDSTKWYMLVAVSYSVLIPYGVWQIYNWLKLKHKFQINTKNKILNTQNAFLVFIIFYLMFLLLPVFAGEVKGTFFHHIIPNEYSQLKNFLSIQPEFFRTLWIPKIQRFGYSSDNHPALSAEELLDALDENSIIKVLQDRKTLLKELGVKYIIVPFDSEGEIFLKERQYDEMKYAQLVSQLEKINFLEKVNKFNKIKVFQSENDRDRLWIKSSQGDSDLTYFKNSPTGYTVNIKNAKKRDFLVFSERYDHNWIAKVNSMEISSTKFDGLLNSFILPQNGDYSMKVLYTPQKWVEIGSATSIFFLFAAVLVILKRK